MLKNKQRTPCDSECRGTRVAIALSLTSWAVFILAWLLNPAMSRADEQPALVPSLGIELNSLAKPASGGCRLNFMLHNNLPRAIESLAFEIVLFDKGGRVNSLLRLSGGALSKGKTRVRQFDLKSTECNNISRVLINEITTCKGEGLTPRTCLQALKATSRTKVAFGL